MVRVMKSPNMMSTTGRIPVMAAPTASPVKPASEIGVSRTRSLPNSSSSPERTLKGVPASATSSPMIQTVASRRISSASASRIACPKVSSRSVFSGIDILVYFADRRIWCCHGEFDCLFHLQLEFGLNLFECCRADEILLHQHFAEICDGIPVVPPHLFFFFRAVVFAIDVAHVMPVVTIRIAQQER